MIRMAAGCGVDRPMKQFPIALAPISLSLAPSSY